MIFFVSLQPHVLLNRRPFELAKVKVRQDVFLLTKDKWLRAKGE